MTERAEWFREKRERYIEKGGSNGLERGEREISGERREESQKHLERKEDKDASRHKNFLGQLKTIVECIQIYWNTAGRLKKME